MTDTNGSGSGPTGAPALNVLVQYVKDLSFENPNAPRSLQPRQNPPEIGIQVNVNARQMSPEDFEVSVTLEASATEGGEVLFKLEVDYGGVFRLLNIPAEQIHPIVMIECPRLLFPFLRQVVADATRNGGFPPLYIDPIDFFALYQQRAAQEQQAPANAN
ncbi:protein-export chaperone SecB [Methylosinus sp. R-45379]|jgi:preprotein translocase subunit SecB|uniref:protein-export chaperone SecB n=1 Tax=unclassified Methylosinus TaxID=2624500 RepID=UPI0004669F65|nr:MULTISPECIES: protein-export chaperone SecB [unclassified Methylosinus]OAI27965.1 protein-export chaperone SecB [Methylosinus sp. R-45379]TDX67010.1 protein translocase subunit secB [Methylosinus sp. sav-2]